MARNKAKGKPSDVKVSKKTVTGADGRKKEITKKVTTTKKTTSKTVPTKRPNQKSFKGAFIGMSVLSFLLLGGLAYPIYLVVTTPTTSAKSDNSNVDLSKYTENSKIEAAYNLKLSSVDVSDEAAFPTGTYKLTQPTKAFGIPLGTPTLTPVTAVDSAKYILKADLAENALYKATGTEDALSLGTDLTNKYIEKSTITPNELYKPTGTGDALVLGSSVTNNYVDVSAVNEGTYTLKKGTGVPTLETLVVVDPNSYIKKSTITPNALYKPTGADNLLTLGNSVTNNYVDVSSTTNYPVNANPQGLYTLTKTGAVAPTLTDVAKDYTKTSTLATGLYTLAKPSSSVAPTLTPFVLAENGLYKVSGTPATSLTLGAVNVANSYRLVANTYLKTESVDVSPTHFVDGGNYVLTGKGTNTPKLDFTLEEKLKHFNDGAILDTTKASPVGYRPGNVRSYPIKDLLNVYLPDIYALTDSDITTIIADINKYKFELHLGHRSRDDRTGKVTNWDGADQLTELTVITDNPWTAPNFGLRFDRLSETLEILADHAGGLGGDNARIRLFKINVVETTASPTTVDVSAATFLTGETYVLTKDGINNAALVRKTYTLDEKIALLNDYGRLYDLTKKLDTGFTNRSLRSLLNIGLTDEQKFTAEEVSTILTDTDYKMVLWIGDRRAQFINNLYKYPNFTSLGTTRTQLRFNTPDTYYSFFLNYTVTTTPATQTTPASTSATMTLTSNNLGAVNFAGAFRGISIYKHK